MRPWQPALSIAVLATALITTLLRTLRLPNDWAEAHWLLDYRFGFVKRGLPGELLRWLAAMFGQEVGAGTIAIVSLALMGLLVALMFAMAVGILRAGGYRPGVVAATVAFACSPFVVMTGHLTGYFEQLFLPLGIVTVWLALRGRLWTGALLQALALFVHEISIVLVYPAFVFAALLRAARTPAGQRVPSLVPLLLPLAVTLVIARVADAPPPEFVARFSQWLAQHPFIEGGYATITPDLLAWPLSMFWAVVAPKYFERMAMPSSIGLVLPTLMVLMLWLLPRLRAGVLSLPALCLVVVVLVPQAMHLIAFDLERLWTFSLFTAFLATWLLARETTDGADEAEPRGLLPLALLTIVANFLMETPLLDHVSDQMPRAVRAWIMLGVVGTLLVFAAAIEPASWAERWRLRGRSLWDLLRGR